jgi:hypothetical protein
MISGSTYTYGPADIVAALFRMLPRSVYFDGEWLLPCHSGANVTFTFAGKPFTINSKSLV